VAGNKQTTHRLSLFFDYAVNSHKENDAKIYSNPVYTKYEL
jgi:hypothetical protein